MTQDREWKTCPICYEDIDARAGACRYCGHPQSKLATWILRWASLFAALLLIFPVVIVGFLVWSGHALHDRGEDFNPYRDQVKVVSSEMGFEDTEHGPVVYVLGKVTNDSSIPWEGIEIEVQFMDRSGKMIDTTREHLDVHASTVLPGDESGFEVRDRRDFAEERYASHKVFVRFAKDARGRW